MNKESNQIELYRDEIKELRETNSQLKLNKTIFNEQLHRIEIQKLNHIVSVKDREIDLLELEKNSLKQHLIIYERVIKNVFDETGNLRKNICENVIICLM